MFRAVFKFVVLCLAVELASAMTAAELPSEVAAEVAKFKDPDPKVRQKALTALGKMGEKAKPAIPEIAEMSKDKTGWVTTRAMMALAEIGPDETCIKPAIPFLAMGPDYRSFAVDVLVLLKEKAVPALIEALKDDKSAEGASEALEKIGKAAKAAAPQLSDTIRTSKSKPVRDAAKKALLAVNK